MQERYRHDDEADLRLFLYQCPVYRREAVKMLNVSQHLIIILKHIPKGIAIQSVVSMNKKKSILKEL